MQDLIAEIVAATGLDGAIAERGLGIMLDLLKSHGNQMKVDELLAKLPGAAELAAQYGSANAGLLGGGLMGGPLAAIAKLSAAGFSMDQIKQVGMLTLNHAKAKAGDQLVRDVAGAIPGLSGYV